MRIFSSIAKRRLRRPLERAQRRSFFDGDAPGFEAPVERQEERARGQVVEVIAEPGDDGYEGGVGCFAEVWQRYLDCRARSETGLGEGSDTGYVCRVKEEAQGRAIPYRQW